MCIMQVGHFYFYFLCLSFLNRGAVGLLPHLARLLLFMKYFYVFFLLTNRRNLQELRL